MLRRNMGIVFTAQVKLPSLHLLGGTVTEREKGVGGQMEEHITKAKG